MNIHFTNIGWIDLTCTGIGEIEELIEENDIDRLFIDDWESEASTEIARNLNLLVVGYISIEDVEELIKVCEVLEKEDADMILAYDTAVGGYDDIDRLIADAKQAYYGEFDSNEEFGKNYAQETTTVPKEFEIYINWDDYADDLLTDFLEANGYYFLLI